MYNREQPESARASQDETSSQEYPAENHSKFVITCLLSVKAQYLCAVSYLMPCSKNSHALVLPTVPTPQSLIWGHM